MHVVVCVKQVPEVAEAELELTREGERDLEDLVLGVNEWDDYAVETAIRLQESQGGRVTVVSLGDDEAEDVLRRALAMGADEAVRIESEDFEGCDAHGIASALAAAIRPLEPDLVLAGAQSSDTGWGQVGPRLAALLDLPHATLAIRLEVEDGRAVVHRELESNTEEVVELTLPALVTVQTGICEPRYVSVMGIRRVRRLPIRVLEAEELDLEPPESSVRERRLSLPVREGGAELLVGRLEAICERTADLIRAAVGG